MYTVYLLLLCVNLIKKYVMRSLQMCDLGVGVLAPMHSRFEWMDFLYGYVEGRAAMIIPKPQPFKINISAITKPFQFWV